MTSIRDILADNLKENRKRCGFSQAKLAEEADTSTQYIAMIEISRKFPSPEMLDRIAKALGIETHELFMVKPSPEDAMKQLHDTLVSNIERVVGEALGKALDEKGKNKVK
jgi:transcriptional regulator with XRE-family HTH domain